MFVFMDLTRREQIVSSLADKTYRDAFVADQIRIGVPLQIRQMRDERGLSQEELGQQMQPPMVQESVWRLENPNKANLTIGTLLRVASSLDVGLMVRFLPFSELLDSTPWISGQERAVPPFLKDQGLRSPATALTKIDVSSVVVSDPATIMVTYSTGGMDLVFNQVNLTTSVDIDRWGQLTGRTAAATQLARVA